MKRLIVLAMLAFVSACGSPEAERVRGGGLGADKGHRGDSVVMHEGSRPYAGTPRLIPTEPPPLDGARQAHKLSRE